MQDGYTLQRYLLQTGEEAVSLYRGPLTPAYVPPISQTWWPYQSDFSTDYQVLDRELGIIDITYAVAWQLGRTLGIADQAFTAALVRLRSTVQTTARRATKKDTGIQGSVKSKAETFASLAASVNKLATLGKAAPGENVSDPARRFVTTNEPAPGFAGGGGTTKTIKHNVVQRAAFESHVIRQTAQLGSAKNTNSKPSDNATEEEVFIPFNDINIPNSSDWQTVQTWVVSNLFLKNIPTHYLIPDPSFLQRESIKFFYIDTNWMDAFIDGALSIGNHLGERALFLSTRVGLLIQSRSAGRCCQTSIQAKSKSILQQQVQHCTPDASMLPSDSLFWLPSSQLRCQSLPELGSSRSVAWTRRPKRPTTRRAGADTTSRNTGKDVLLCLFDRFPGSQHWSEKTQITLSQPPHQQCFRLGTPGGVTATDVEVEFKRVFTTDEALPLDPLHPTETPDRYAPVKPIVNWMKDETGPYNQCCQ
jgi:hypothetical protein